MHNLLVLVLFILLPSVGMAEFQTHNQYDSLFKKFAKQEGISWKLLKAISLVETFGTKDPEVAISSAFALGVCQIMIGTFEDLQRRYPADFGEYTLIDLMDSETNIKVTARLLGILERLALKRYPKVKRYSKEHLNLIGIAYNAGLSRWQKVKAPKYNKIGIRETDQYIVKLNTYFRRLGKA